MYQGHGSFEVKLSGNCKNLYNFFEKLVVQLQPNLIVTCELLTR